LEGIYAVVASFGWGGGGGAEGVSLWLVFLFSFLFFSFLFFSFFGGVGVGLLGGWMLMFGVVVGSTGPEGLDEFMESFQHKR